MRMNFLLWALVCLALPATASHGASFTINDYNQSLPVWGTSWAPGSDAESGYYPSFYTGFAIRNANPARIHVRLARGNQTRVSQVLDEQTIADYLFDLAKRYSFYRSVTSGSRPLLDVSPSGSVSPQLNQFNKTIESDAYSILPFVAGAKAGRESTESIYRKSLETLSALNPGRVFMIRLDLTSEFKKWRSQVKAMLGSARDTDSFFSAHPDKAITAINSLVFGRVNFTQQVDANMVAKLASVTELVNLDWSDDEFVAAALSLFKTVTGKKYDFRVLDADGSWKPAIQCANAASCYLVYPEFTAVYPTGSVKATTQDQFGNSIPSFATPGLWSFISRSGGRDVDNIRDEPYYGWIPKMDYEDIGNGFHNPAVRFNGLSSSVKSMMGIPASHRTFWSVMRGGVSHGCSRLPVGHAWELRHIFPVDTNVAAQVHFFGSDPRDFDVFDIDGNGTPEVIGVEYLISYGLQQADGLGSREGTDLDISSGKKLDFYKKLYGSRGVFTTTGNGHFLFSSPTVSMPSYLDYKKTKVQTRISVNETLRLYEAAYERDKIQFYSLPGGLNKKLIRLMGRVRGCAPSANKESCGEAVFDREASKYVTIFQ